MHYLFIFYFFYKNYEDICTYSYCCSVYLLANFKKKIFNHRMAPFQSSNLFVQGIKFTFINTLIYFLTSFTLDFYGILSR